MSYPSSLDLAFGSEKATSDSNNSFVQSMSFDNGGSEPALPTTYEEVNELINQGLAFRVGVSEESPYALDLTVHEETFPQAVKDSLPENLKGIVINGSELDTVESVNYTISGSDDSLTIEISSPAEKNIAIIILKQAVDTNP